MPDGMDEGEAESVIRVMVVDDEALVRSGFELISRSQDVLVLVAQGLSNADI
jgi:DNA-binding NarL/FixJ family response regulator